MRWKYKAKIASIVDSLPGYLGSRTYHCLQRYCGGLSKVDTLSRLVHGVRIAEAIHNHGYSVDGKSFLEIGTGWRLNLAIALWLCGAGEITTVDLNPYLERSLVRRDISYMREHQISIVPLFHSGVRGPSFPQRLHRLQLTQGDLGELLTLMNTRYISPADASHLCLPDASIDYHVSSTVLEHCAPEVIRSMLLEGKRLLVNDGLYLHHIDLSDHFSHVDRSISSVNFLQFSDSRWMWHAGNRRQYHNRLRLDDFLELFGGVGLEILSVDTYVDEGAVQTLTQGFAVNQAYGCKTPETNATTYAFVVARRADCH